MNYHWLLKILLTIVARDNVCIAGHKVQRKITTCGGGGIYEEMVKSKQIVGGWVDDE